MPPPSTVSLQVPYAETEQEFLLLAVQAAVRMFRTIDASSYDRMPARSTGEATVSESLASAGIQAQQN
jgi:hypothetical protein